MAGDSRFFRNELEELARSFGLDFYPVEFEVVPPSFMTEVAVYGLPVRMPHWSFGVRTGRPDSYALGGQEDVWNAIRRFFTQQATQED